VLPFVSVGCDTPGGYAGTSPGGSTTYNGVALAVGGQPDVTEGHERPVPPGEDDRLPPQPAAAVVLLLIVAATAFAIRVAEPRPRRAYVGGLAAAGATGLLVNQALVQAELTLRVSDHLTRLAAAGQKLDPTKVRARLRPHRSGLRPVSAVAAGGHCGERGRVVASPASPRARVRLNLT
jgi:hypothetical protein